MIDEPQLKTSNQYNKGSKPVELNLSAHETSREPFSPSVFTNAFKIARKENPKLSLNEFRDNYWYGKNKTSLIRGIDLLRAALQEIVRRSHLELFKHGEDGRREAWNECRQIALKALSDE